MKQRRRTGHLPAIYLWRHKGWEGLVTRSLFRSLCVIFGNRNSIPLSCTFLHPPKIVAKDCLAIVQSLDNTVIWRITSAFRPYHTLRPFFCDERNEKHFRYCTAIAATRCLIQMVGWPNATLSFVHGQKAHDFWPLLTRERNSSWTHES